MEVTGLGKLSPNMALLGFQEKWASDTDGNSAFLKRSNPSLFFIYFWYFQTNNIIFRTNPFEKMLYPYFQACLYLLLEIFLYLYLGSFV